MPRWMRNLAIFLGILNTIVVVVGVATWVYRYRGERLSKQAWNVYDEGRPAEALALYRTIAQQYPPFFGDFARSARYSARRLENYLRAVDLQDSGQVDKAIAAYESFLDKHFGGYLYASLARETLARLKLQQAQSLRDDGEYAKAIEVYQSVLGSRTIDCAPKGPWDEWGMACQQADIAVEEGHAQAEAAIPPIFLEWAKALAQRGDYEEAIEKYQLILKEYPETLSREQAEAILAELNGEWAAQLDGMGDYEGAMEKYQTILREYPDTPTGAQAEAILAELYGKWAAQLRKAEDYEGAIEKYQIILREYPDTPTGARAEMAIAETRKELAAWREKNWAVPVAEFPKEISRDSDGRWSWTIVFKETGGKVGYTLSGEGWIIDTEGGRWGSWGHIIDRGSVTVPAGGKAEDSYWVKGDTFANGYAIFTWSGEDASGHPITIEEKVHLLP